MRVALTPACNRMPFSRYHASGPSGSCVAFLPVPNPDLLAPSRHGQLRERTLRRACERTPVFRAEESLVAGAHQLFACLIEMHRAGEMRAALVEGHELLR